MGLAQRAAPDPSERRVSSDAQRAAAASSRGALGSDGRRRQPHGKHKNTERERERHTDTETESSRSARLHGDRTPIEYKIMLIHACESKPNNNTARANDKSCDASPTFSEVHRGPLPASVAAAVQSGRPVAAPGHCRNVLGQGHPKEPKGVNVQQRLRFERTQPGDGAPEESSQGPRKGGFEDFPSAVSQQSVHVAETQQQCRRSVTPRSRHEKLSGHKRPARLWHPAGEVFRLQGLA